MASTRRRHQKPSQANISPRSLSPDSYIDLTVDSPVRTPTQTSFIVHEDPPAMMRISRIPTWAPQQIPARIINQDLPEPPRSTRRLSIELDSFDDVILNNNNFQENISIENIVIDDTDSIPVISLKNSPDTRDRSAASCLSCPICFEELLNTSITAYTTKCGHIFCETCLKKATETRKKCPMCLKAVNIKQCVRLHI